MTKSLIISFGIILLVFYMVYEPQNNLTKTKIKPMYTKNLFERVFENFDESINSAFAGNFNIHRDGRISELEDSIVFEFPLPGYAKDDVTIEIDSNYLVISADIEEPTYFRKSFTKRYEVSAKYDVENASAELKNGLLEIKINRTKKQKKIKIK